MKGRKRTVIRKTESKRRKEYVKMPRSVQDTIPVKIVYDDGIFCVGKNQFSRAYRFEDINYQVASEEDKETMFEKYSGLLNSLDSSADTKITIFNRKLNTAEFKSRILIDKADDSLDMYREEYNRMLLHKGDIPKGICQFHQG